MEVGKEKGANRNRKKEGIPPLLQNDSKNTSRKNGDTPISKVK
jgi:hypothetical protein